MSVNPSDQRHKNPTGSPEPEPSPAVPAELASVDKRLRRLQDEVLPSAPYLLTVPTDVPFHLGNRFVNNWAVGKKGPFAVEEQQLQYMTFLMHHDADSLLVAVGDWTENDGQATMGKKDDEKPRALPSASGTPQVGGIKKKITLSDYKTRAKGEPSKEQSRTTSQEPSQEPSQDSTRKEKNESLQMPPSRTIKERSSHDRMVDSNSLAMSPNSKRPLKESSKHASDAPAPKRARLTPPRSTEASLPSRGGKSSIPALLSPTLPPTTTSPQLSKLPELLSPTLPPELEEELARIVDETPLSKDSKRDATTVPKVSKNTTPNTKAPSRDRAVSDSKPATNKIDMKEESKTSLLAASGKNNKKHRGSDQRSTSPYEQKSPLLNATAKSSVAHNTTTGSTTAKTLLVKLRYGRGNRKRVGALLKFGGKRKLSDSVPSRASKESLSGDEDLESSRSDTKLRAKIRDRSPEDTKMEEEQRATTSAGKTIPSHTNSFKSPSNKRLPVSKAEALTPAKESRFKPQRQADSAEAEVKTPSGISGKSLATTTDKSIKMSPPNGDSQLSSRDKERRAWREEFQKHTGWGRELKHIADRYSRAKATSEHVSITDGKLAAVTAIEAILCFIVAFIANDRSKTLSRQVVDSETWRSIIPYWRVVERTTAAYPHLHGLCLILGAVSHDTINSLDLERLAVCPVPGEQSPVPTPGSDGNTVHSDRSKSQKREFFELKSRLPENHKEANRLWLEGCGKLPDDVLAKEFPDTWTTRSRNYIERGHDSFKPGHYAGAFFLPFGRTTTPMEAVRFGTMLLREWCDKENIDFKARLKL